MLEQKRSVWFTVLACFIVFLFLFILIKSFYGLDYQWDFSVLKNYLWIKTPNGHYAPGLFFQGLYITVKMSFISIFFGTILGFFIGFLLIKNEIVSKISALFYVDLFRNTPVLVQLYISYFIVGTAFNLSGEAAGILTLSLFCAAYVAEIFRGTVSNFDKGQIDAAKALGLTQFQIVKRIIAPQTLKLMLPPLIGQFVSLIKDSSLLSVVAIPELTKEAQNAVTVTFRSFEIWFFIAVLYFVVNTVVSSLGRLLEKNIGITHSTL